MSHSDQNTPNLYRTFPTYGRGMEAGKPCAARMFHTFHTFQTCSPAACAYGCERAPARTRTRVHLSLFRYGKYGRYGRGPQHKGFEAPDLCHTSNRYGTPATQQGMLLGHSLTNLACSVGLHQFDVTLCQRGSQFAPPKALKQDAVALGAKASRRRYQSGNPLAMRAWAIYLHFSCRHLQSGGAPAGPNRSDYRSAKSPHPQFAGPSTGLLPTGSQTPVCPLLFSLTKGVM